MSDKRVFILLEDLFEDLEFWYPLIRMREAGYEVVSVAPSKRAYHGKNGLRAEADAEADSVSADQADALIIPGGYSPDRMRRHPAMVKLVKEVYERGRTVAAICHGGWMLASAGVLQEKTATGDGRTVHPIAEDEGKDGSRRQQQHDHTLELGEEDVPGASRVGHPHTVAAEGSSPALDFRRAQAPLGIDVNGLQYLLCALAPRMLGYMHVYRSSLILRNIRSVSSGRHSLLPGVITAALPAATP